MEAHNSQGVYLGLQVSGQAIFWSPAARRPLGMGGQRSRQRRRASKEADQTHESKKSNSDQGILSPVPKKTFLAHSGIFLQ
jgi:hypothetical protein